ncbi:nicotianamine synthase family protein [Phytoactinopolyspora halotolerans]|uniref:Methyltransferase domain-containing protein n=1 Tax=Phytoactinopolyspora halotolerans TaxID=1981512 RepID=A0A6L9SC49_9ACTN|nr:nicotianamine synthase family protein [Phytoactinopolyspora halotolerans]NEE02945.1 methyltransferase domain-containing protein [Phytoactinopolyspora halotolerans]
MTLLDTRIPATTDADVAAAVCSIYRALDSCPDLTPGPHVDGLFGRLVQLVLNTPEPVALSVLEDPAVRASTPHLRRLCARGETELERRWAERICRSADPQGELHRFPYLDNYRRLIRMEAAALDHAWFRAARADQRAPRTVAFVGSGPLPLSSFFLADHLEVPVHNIDRDADVVAGSRMLAEALGRTDVRFRHADAASVDLRGYDVVVLAALVGETAADKDALLCHLATAMDPGALLLLRSARGMRTLLYPEVTPSASAGFEVLATVHPDDEVINSAIVLRADGVGRRRDQGEEG